MVGNVLNVQTFILIQAHKDADRYCVIPPTVQNYCALLTVTEEH